MIYNFVNYVCDGLSVCVGGGGEGGLFVNFVLGGGEVGGEAKNSG